MEGVLSIQILKSAVALDFSQELVDLLVVEIATTTQALKCAAMVQSGQELLAAKQ